MNKQAKIFISYSTKDSESVKINELIKSKYSDSKFIISERKTLGFKASISEFVKQVGKGQYVIIIISDSYIKDTNCMEEASELMKNQNLRERIFPIVLEDANIYDPIEMIDYLNYWDDKAKKLEDAVKKITNMAYASSVYADLNKINDIRRIVGDFNGTISDLNVLTPEMHQNSNFKELFSAINKKIELEHPGFSNLQKIEVEEKDTDINNIKDLDKLKKELKKITAIDIESSISILEDKVDEESDIFNSLMMVLGSYSRLKKKYDEKIISESKYEIEVNKIQKSLMNMIDRIEDFDIKL